MMNCLEKIVATMKNPSRQNGAALDQFGRRSANMPRHFPKGLDDRMRDKDGEIRHKRRDTLVRTIREEIPNFAPKYRGDTKLGTVLDDAKCETLDQYLRQQRLQNRLNVLYGRNK